MVLVVIQKYYSLESLTNVLLVYIVWVVPMQNGGWGSHFCPLMCEDPYEKVEICCK